MRLLLVDDQKEITESLKKSIDWAAAGIDEVCTAVSSKEAKLIMVNVEIDILLTDIEMPGESGLELFQWTRERYPDIIGIFLTSHAEFAYAQEAIRMGGFDYILQPARYQEVACVVAKASQRSRENTHTEKIVKQARLLADQCDNLLELMFMRYREGKYEESAAYFDKLRNIYRLKDEKFFFRVIWVQIVRFEKEVWSDGLLKMVFRNVLEELFGREDSVSAACIDDGFFCVMQMFGSSDMEPAKWKDGIERFHSFINEHMDFKIAIYPEVTGITEFPLERLARAYALAKSDSGRCTDIFWEGGDAGMDPVRSNEDCIRIAEKYIRDNISRSVSRAEVAEYLNFNEEYFSRLFKKYNGDTFKAYEMKERIREAKKLLQYSNFSINIIASKVGYDNFSHFSKIFKQATGYTPQEYRGLKSQK